jgi:hypothetical protein
MTRTVKLLFCNVGSSDLDRAPLEELNRLNERERARRILAAWETYAPRLRLPIIGKALRYVLNQPGDLARLVLIASDQGDTPPDDPYLAELWGKDTCGTAQVIRRALAAGCDGLPALAAERIDIWTIADRHGRERDPSDYDGVRRFFERRLPDMARAFPTATVYLEVTGGTPAMTTGLLVAGSEVWGARATALYVHPRYALPQTLNTTTRLLAAPLRAALRANASTFDYDAALRLLRDHRSAIADRLIPGADQVLEAVLDHARCRFNFDLRGARRALEGGVDRLGDGRWRADLIALYEAVSALIAPPGLPKCTTARLRAMRSAHTATFWRRCRASRKMPGVCSAWNAARSLSTARGSQTKMARKCRAPGKSRSGSRFATTRPARAAIAPSIARGCARWRVIWRNSAARIFAALSMRSTGSTVWQTCATKLCIRLKGLRAATLPAHSSGLPATNRSPIASCRIWQTSMPQSSDVHRRVAVCDDQYAD